MGNKNELNLSEYILPYSAVKGPVKTRFDDRYILIRIFLRHDLILYTTI
jgi:hypothetical protein